MRIKVDRDNTESGDLIFKITVSNPMKVPFAEAEREVMNAMKLFQASVNLQQYDDLVLKEDIISLSYNIQKETFDRCLSKLKRDIELQFKPRFQHICQEIYNWHYDQQNKELKTWMTEFDAQRTKYYFDNDITAESNSEPQQSEHEEEDDDDTWQED